MCSLGAMAARSVAAFTRSSRGCANCTRTALHSSLRENNAPLVVGDPVGTLRVLSDGEIQFEAPLVALEAVEPGGFFARLWDMLLMWLNSLFRG